MSKKSKSKTTDEEIDLEMPSSTKTLSTTRTSNSMVDMKKQLDLRMDGIEDNF